MTGMTEKMAAVGVEGFRARRVAAVVAVAALLPAGMVPADAASAQLPAVGAVQPLALPTAGSATGNEIRRTVAALERKHHAHISVALLPVGSTAKPWTTGTFANGPAWSTSKVPLAMAAQRKYPKGPATAQRMRRAITASDNAAAEAMWRSLGTPRQAASATTRILRESGDRTTTVPSTRRRAGYSIFGQTAWRPSDQVRFAAAMPCRRDARTTLQLMGQVRADQRWGLGTIRGAQFKGGWGPQPSGRYVVRQMGVVTVKGQKMAVVVAVSGVSFATGTRITSQLAQQIAKTPPRMTQPTRTC